MQVRLIEIAYRYGFCLAFLLISCGCTTAPGQLWQLEDISAAIIGQSKPFTERSWVLSDDACIVAAPSRDPALSQYQAAKMHTHLTQALAANFARVEQGAESASLAQLLRQADDARCHYLVSPELLSATDRMNGLPELTDDFDATRIGSDQLMVKLLLYDVYARQLIDVSAIRVQTRWLNLSDQNPTDLLQHAFNTYANGLGTAARAL